MRLFPRENYLKKIRGFYHDDGMIKVITGVRRCGKSCLMQCIAKELRAEGVDDERIVFSTSTDTGTGPPRSASTAPLSRSGTTIPSTCWREAMSSNKGTASFMPTFRNSCKTERSSDGIYRRIPGICARSAARSPCCHASQDDGRIHAVQRGGPFGGIYDDRLLLKDVPAARKSFPTEDIPYEGAKPMLLVDSDDPALITATVAAMLPQLPPPKKNRKSPLDSPLR